PSGLTPFSSHPPGPRHGSGTEQSAGRVGALRTFAVCRHCRGGGGARCGAPGGFTQSRNDAKRYDGPRSGQGHRDPDALCRAPPPSRLSPLAICASAGSTAKLMVPLICLHSTVILLINIIVMEG